MREGKIKALSIFVFCLFVVVLALPNFMKVNFLPQSLNNKVNYGLDLRGGVQVLLKADFKSFMSNQFDIIAQALRKEARKNQINISQLKINEEGLTFEAKSADESSQVTPSKLKKVLASVDGSLDFQMKDNAVKVFYPETQRKELLTSVMDQTVEIIRHRIDENGTLEPSIQRQGDFAVVVQVPGLSDPSELKNLLGKTAKLSFHLVEAEVSAADKDKINLPYWAKLLPGDEASGSGSWYVLHSKASMMGDVLTNAQLSNQTEPLVLFNLNSLGTKVFAELTSKSVGKRLAIVLDDVVISAPAIKQPIIDGSGTISGNFTVSSANQLALLLRAGALPAPLKILEETVVGPSLGADSIALGKKAAIVALIAVAILMVGLYGFFGIFACMALVVNICGILMIMGLIGATLTMPGIAGIILTLGMAVDTNVLIFERIKEEMRSNLPLKYCIKQGFKNAFSTIFDSNVTTLIAAFFLYAYGSGIIRGFAVTLTIGILCSMFTAITFTKLLIHSFVRGK